MLQISVFLQFFWADFQIYLFLWGRGGTPYGSPTKAQMLITLNNTGLSLGAFFVQITEIACSNSLQK